MFRQCRHTGNLVETSRKNLDRGLAVVRKNYDSSVRRGRYSQQQVDAILANITGTTEYADIAGVDLVIEAVFENMAVKQEVFRTLDATCKADCILATNTSPGCERHSGGNGPPATGGERALVSARQRDETAGSGARGTDRARGAADVYATGENDRLRSRWRWACVTALSATACSGLRPPGPVAVAGRRQPRAGRRRHGSLGHGYGSACRGDLAGWISATARAATRLGSRSAKESALADTLVEMERHWPEIRRRLPLRPATRARHPDPGSAALIEDIAARWQGLQRAIERCRIVDRLTWP